jgi:hypothetical protein
MKNILLATALTLGLVSAQAQQPPPRTHLVIVVDGLRPDYGTPEVMPRLVRQWVPALL